MIRNHQNHIFNPPPADPSISVRQIFYPIFFIGAFLFNTFGSILLDILGFCNSIFVGDLSQIFGRESSSRNNNNSNDGFSNSKRTRKMLKNGRREQQHQEGDEDGDEFGNALRNYHRKGHDYLKEALKLDESSDSKLSKSSALNYYRKGIAEFEKGLALNPREFRCTDDNGERRQRNLRLREKIMNSWEMAKGRVIDLEKIVFSTGMPSTSGAVVRPNSAPRPVRTEHRSKSPCTRRPIPIGSPLRPKQQAPASKPPPAVARAVPAAPSENLADRAKKKLGLDSHLANLILDQLLEKKLNVTFADIAGLDNAKRALREAVILPALNPELFTGLRSPVQGLLLFGPPGNGKTMLAKAIAAEANCNFFNISASDLTSKWVGEAEKLVRSLFVLARDLQPSVVFIDEIDSILCQRGQNEHEASRRLKTEFLSQFDGVASSSSDRILIMGATNRPFDLDDAVLRRMAKRIYIPLPDMACREELLRNLLAKQSDNCSLSSYDLRAIAMATDGYSNSDLSALAKEAAMGPLRDVPPERLTKMRDYQLRPISANDFREALRQVRPSTKMEQLAGLELFNRNHGS